MRTEVLTAFVVGAIFFFPSAIMTALAIKYATSSRLWDVILIVGIAGMICSVATLALFVNSQNKELPILWPALLVNLGICLVVVGIGWHFSGIAAFQEKSDVTRPLRRLIAYWRDDLLIPWDGNAPQFQGYNVGVQNVSNDTITARVMFLNADVDGMQVMASSVPSPPVIIAQTQGTIFQARHTPPESHPIPLDANTITTEFEVDYDTIPESGVRRSYKKIAYHLNWANGKNSAPLLEPQTVDEWER